MVCVGVGGRVGGVGGRVGIESLGLALPGGSAGHVTTGLPRAGNDIVIDFWSGSNFPLTSHQVDRGYFFRVPTGKVRQRLPTELRMREWLLRSDQRRLFVWRWLPWWKLWRSVSCGILWQRLPVSLSLHEWSWMWSRDREVRLRTGLDRSPLWRHVRTGFLWKRLLREVSSIRNSTVPFHPPPPPPPPPPQPRFWVSVIEFTIERSS